jgi:chromosome segregation ATPase
MDETTKLILLAIVSGLLGAPMMTFLGQWLGARLGLRQKEIETETDIAKQVREQEYADLMSFRQEQQRAMTSLRLEHRTLKEAHEDLERKHDALEREYRSLSEKVNHLNGELERVRAENVTLKSRISELERDNYRLLAELESLRRGAT